MMTPNKAVKTTKTISEHVLSVLEKFHTLDFAAQITLHPTHSILFAMLIAPIAKYAGILALGAMIGFLAATVFQKRRSAASPPVKSEREDKPSTLVDVLPPLKFPSSVTTGPVPFETEVTTTIAGTRTIRRFRYYEVYEETTTTPENTDCTV